MASCAFKTYNCKNREKIISSSICNTRFCSTRHILQLRVTTHKSLEYNSQINIVYYFHYIYILCVYSIVFVILNTT